MAYKVIILYRLYMPSYFLGTFTEYPWVIRKAKREAISNLCRDSLLKKRNLEMYRFTTAFLKTLGAIFELPQLYFPSVYFLQHNQDGYLPN